MHTILDLPIEILINICAKLELFGDKKNFALAHPKLFDAFAYHSRKEVQSDLDFDKNLKFAYHWSFVLEWFGSSLTSIRNCPDCCSVRNLIEVAAKFCPNLKKINIVNKYRKYDQVEESLSKLQALEYFYTTATFTQPIVLKLVKTCPSLKALSCFCCQPGKTFLPNLLDILKAKGFQPDQPFLLKMGSFQGRIQNLETQLATIPNSNLLNLKLYLISKADVNDGVYRGSADLANRY